MNRGNMTKSTQSSTQRDIPGSRGEWTLPTTRPNPDPAGNPTPDEIEVSGIFLGWSSSQRPTHAHPVPGVPGPGVRCSACRWSEFRIYRTTDGMYLIHYTGRSQIEGETNRYRHETCYKATEVVEILTTRKDQGKAFLTIPAARVLSQASASDADLLDAYENRAVV